MDKAKFAKRVAIWTAIITALIIAVVNIVKWNVVEANTFEEITKIVFMGLGIIVVIECLVLWPALTIYDHKHKDDGK